MNYELNSRRQAEELRSKETVRILSLETSCDETAAAVIENGRKILSNVVFSQIDLHELYGGVVPEIASRAHMEACDRVVDQALREAGMSLQDVDALAVTKGPGLVGALLTGVNCMKGLAFAAGKPLVGVNHIEGHVSANYLSHPDLEPPSLCLVVSGGHSHLVEVSDYGTYHLLGQTGVVLVTSHRAVDVRRAVVGRELAHGIAAHDVDMVADGAFRPYPAEGDDDTFFCHIVSFLF